MRLRSPLIHCLLVLTLASAQWVGGVHAFAHLDAPIVGDASADDAPGASASPGAEAEALVATPPSHGDGPTCASCLALGAAQVSVPSELATRSAPMLATLACPARGPGASTEPPHARPPARGPPARS